MVPILIIIVTESLSDIVESSRRSNFLIRNYLSLSLVCLKQKNCLMP